MLAGLSQAIGTRFCGRIVVTSVAPEFTPRHNSKLRGSRGLNADDGVRLEVGEKQVRTAQVAGSRFDVLAVLRLVGDGESLLLRQMQFGTAPADG
ncbi:MAG: hypothetical protein WCD11_17275 [Solirubrobacteraceae bacterium]